MSLTKLRHGLYAITAPELIAPERWRESVEAAIAGGAVMIQYRDKNADAATRERRARELLETCRRRGVPLIINDDVDLARAIGADGVHVGLDDAACVQARAVLGREAIIGVSCYNDFQCALRAQAQGADYVAFGRFFPSRIKPQAVQASLDLLQRTQRELHIPVAAIGGITPENGAVLIAAGADILAVIHGIFGQLNVQKAAQDIAGLFEPEISG